MHNGKAACVTGASGLVGSRIVERLIAEGYEVRALSRGARPHDARVRLFRGSINDESVLERFLDNADILFHCAAELHDESRMWEVNVGGTESLLNAAKKNGIRYLCHMSSAGVVGKINLEWVDEAAPCNPQNEYEKSKWAAERLVMSEWGWCSIVVLRPTNVVDNSRPGALSVPMRGSFPDRVKAFVNGGECAHIVHADDVAAAALYFASHPVRCSPECFFVSYDADPRNTLAWMWSLYRARARGLPLGAVRPALHLPVIIPHIIRRLRRGCGNKGNVKYSSKKLVAAGFKFQYGVIKSVDQVLLKDMDHVHEGIKCKYDA